MVEKVIMLLSAPMSLGLSGCSSQLLFAIFKLKRPSPILADIRQLHLVENRVKTVLANPTGPVCLNYYSLKFIKSLLHIYDIPS